MHTLKERKLNLWIRPQFLNKIYKGLESGYTNGEALFVTHRHSIFSIWLGLTDLMVETVFRTSDGFVTRWMNWDAAFPVGKAGHTEGVNDCVMRVGSEGEWKDADCSLEKMFYCEG